MSKDGCEKINKIKSNPGQAYQSRQPVLFQVISCHPSKQVRKMIYEKKLSLSLSFSRVRDGLLVYHSRTKAILYRDLYRAGIITGASMGKHARMLVFGTRLDKHQSRCHESAIRAITVYLSRLSCRDSAPPLFPIYRC